MSELGDARVAVAAALSGVGVTVHDQPPEAVRPPCVVIFPGSPWITPRGHVGLDVTIYANAAGSNATALTRLEDLTEAARHALYAAGMAPGIEDRPTPDTDPGMLHATIPVIVRMSRLE